MDLQTTDILLFDEFRLDRGGGGLFRQLAGDAAEPLTIGSRALEVLGILIDRRGQLVAKGKLMDAVWPDTVVTENNLAVQISALRRLLDHGRSEGSCIQTVPGRGYRFVGTVTRFEAETRAIPAALPQSGARPRLSIVVLPFKNLNDDKEQQYFADGITEDLTTDLSRIPDMLVISCNTAFTYRNRPIDTKQIGRELRVRYAMEGSVRRSGTRVRVTAQLIDAEADAHLWAEQFDRDIGDLLALQNEITPRIANALNVQLITAEAARPTADPDALDYILLGRAAFAKGPGRTNLAEALHLFEQALILNPRSVEAQAQIANTLMSRLHEVMTESAADDIVRAEALIDQVLLVSSGNCLAHFAKGQALRARRRCQEALREYETVILLDRNRAAALINVGRCRMLIGLLAEAIGPMEQAIRLSPRDPFVAAWYSSIAQVHLLQSSIDDAILWLERSRSAGPARPIVHIWLAAAYALNGDSESAVAALAKGRGLAGDDRYSSVARLKATQYFGVPQVHDCFATTYFDGLRRAGMPEE